MRSKLYSLYFYVPAFFFCSPIMSSTSTPTKKRKMSSSTGSWRQIIKKIHGDEGETLKLLPLLTEMEDYNVFIINKKKAQITLLQSVLGDDSSLVDEIMKIFESVSCNLCFLSFLLSYRMLSFHLSYLCRLPPLPM